MVQRVVSVDPHGTGLECVGHLNSGVEVLGVHGGGETVGGGVAHADGLLLGLELGNAADGAEDLLLHDLHVLGDVGEDGRLDEVADVTLALAAGLDGRTGLLAVFDVAGRGNVSIAFTGEIDGGFGGLLHDAVELHLGDLRTLEGVGGEWVANNVLRCPLLEPLNECVVDTLLHVDAATSAAALSVVEENTEVDPRDGVVNVGVVEDNVWRLAAELEGDFFL